MIDEHELLSVLQILKDGTISQAAKNLFVSQPSLSQCIKKIENELGMQIFDRRQTPLQLTEAGKIYVQSAKKMQEIHKNLLRQIDDLSELNSGQLRIGSSRTRSVCFLADRIVAFHQRYPKVHLSIVEGSTERLKEHVIQGNVDFALLYEPLDKNNFKTVSLIDENVIMAVPQQHPLAREFKNIQPIPYPKISFTAFDNEEFIVLKQGRRMCQIYNKLCNETKVTPHVVFEADSIMSAAELCAKGMGSTLVTDMVIDRGLWKEPPFFFDLEETLEKRQLVAAYSRQQILPRAAQVFLQFIR